ncbi:MAG: ImmA/IrrE family metallo-endopeptidase [Terriglobia bacterium]|jgi:Zn-dependent peptidase ImmA (M78 family)
MTRAQLIAAASGAALLAHRMHHVDRQRRVDVFDILRAAASEVFFRPLRKVCGAYLPSDGPAPAVLINSNMPLSRQRYTAAHEFGHLFLEHTVVSLDEVVGTSFEERNNWTDEENIAETFAAFFLMPEGLVEASLRELNESELTPQTAYLLSLKMGTSYVATVNHLQTLKKINYAEAAAFRKIQPKAIKAGISSRVASRHDVWILDERWNGQPIYPAVEDTIVVRLPETPTSGYTWVWHRDPESLRVLQDGFADEPTREIGGTRVRELVTEVSCDAHEERIDLERRQPWDDDGKPSAHFSVDLFPQQMRKSGPLVLPTLAAS